jgi:hypothetical protein
LKLVQKMEDNVQMDMQYNTYQLLLQLWNRVQPIQEDVRSDLLDNPNNPILKWVDRYY